MNNHFEMPIDNEKFQKFIEESNIFDMTRENMKVYLTNWYTESPVDFMECMRASLETVLERYHFYNNNVSFCKDLERELDYINCWIRITDEEDSLCCDYRTMYDYQLQAFDDTIG